MWVAGAARSALKKLVGLPFENYELIRIPNEKKELKIEIHSAGLLKDDSHALGISFAKSGLDLDITQNLEIWTIVSLEKIFFNNPVETNQINIIAGSGVGIKENTSEICISDFAKEVLYENLLDIIPKGFNLQLEIVFPNGEFLAERTSNKSFGIVDGLSIIGTSAETYSSASPDQLEEAKTKLAQLIQNDFRGEVVFVIGENGLNLAKTHNVNLPIIKIGNWIGPLLVDAAIKKSELGLNPQIDGQLIRLPIPELNEERRTELKKMIKSMGEKCKVSIRNIRRDANDELKKLLKSKEIGEDEEKTFEKNVQNITDKHISIVDEKVSTKEKEIMTI